METSSPRSPEVDAILAAFPEDQRAALQSLRDRLHARLPDAVEGIGYGMPVLRVGGKGVAGFTASKGHCSFHPMSGAVVPPHAERLEALGFRVAPGTVRFTPDHPLPDAVLDDLIADRLREIAKARTGRSG
ncbi:MAG: iron chaperone [Armatimonadota bacterium]